MTITMHSYQKERRNGYMTTWGNFANCMLIASNSHAMTLLFFRFAILQINRTEGNVVISCISGRTRSPMYLVAFLVVRYEHSPSYASSMVNALLVKERGMKYHLDRCGRFFPVVQSMEQIIYFILSFIAIVIILHEIISSFSLMYSIE